MYLFIYYRFRDQINIALINLISNVIGLNTVCQSNQNNKQVEQKTKQRKKTFI